MNNKKTLIIGVVIFAALGAVGLYLVRGGDLSLKSKDVVTETVATVNQNTNSNQNKEVVSAKPQTTPKYSYEYVPNFKDGQMYEYTEATYDGKIVRTNLETKEKTTVVTSVKNAYPPIKPINISLYVLSAPAGTSNIYFTKIPNESDGFPWDIIKYNGDSNTFAKLKISSYYDSPGIRATAKSAPFIVSTDNPQNQEDERSLFLLDLEKDSAKLITKLPQSETFNSCYENNCLGSISGEFKWLDNQYIEAAIYSPTQTETDQWGNLQNKLIEKRKIKVR